MAEPREEVGCVDERDFWFAIVDIKVLQDKNLTPCDKLVYAGLCTFASVNGRRACFPKIKTIAEAVSCSERSVQEGLKRLEAAGYIERRERFREGKQLSSEYVILGHKAQGMGAESAPIEAGGVQNLHPRGAENVPPELEPIELNRTYSPSESEETSPTPTPREDENTQEPSAGEPLCSLDEIPASMHSTADYFLLKTGRSGITAGELSAIRALEKRHTPARIQTEIGKAIARYQNSARPLAALTLEYIWESLKHQTSLPGLRSSISGSKKKAKEDPLETERRADMAALEKAMAESIARRFGGDDP